MVRLVFLVAIVGIGLIFWYKLKTAKPKERKKLVFIGIASGLGAVLLLLAMTGHLNVITAAIAGLFAVAPRVLQYARYLPMFKSMFKDSEEQQAKQAPTSTSSMSKAEACEILGIKSEATKEEILLAHKRMMQKVHPDRGGSDYLAAQINQAKDTLLG